MNILKSQHNRFDLKCSLSSESFLVFKEGEKGFLAKTLSFAEDAVDKVSSLYNSPEAVEARKKAEELAKKARDKVAEEVGTAVQNGRKYVESGEADKDATSIKEKVFGVAVIALAAFLKFSSEHTPKAKEWIIKETKESVQTTKKYVVEKWKNKNKLDEDDVKEHFIGAIEEQESSGNLRAINIQAIKNSQLKKHLRRKSIDVNTVPIKRNVFPKNIKTYPQFEKHVSKIFGSKRRAEQILICSAIGKGQHIPYFWFPKKQQNLKGIFDYLNSPNQQKLMAKNTMNQIGEQNNWDPRLMCVAYYIGQSHVKTYVEYKNNPLPEVVKNKMDRYSAITRKQSGNHPSVVEYVEETYEKMLERA